MNVSTLPPATQWRETLAPQRNTHHQICPETGRKMCISYKNIYAIAGEDPQNPSMIPIYFVGRLMIMENSAIPRRSGISDGSLHKV